MLQCRLKTRVKHCKDRREAMVSFMKYTIRVSIFGLQVGEVMGAMNHFSLF
jgi:hypothetical protein